MLNGKRGVSAVIGVILMVAITVAIAATVYYYVSSYDCDTCGDVSKVKHFGTLQGIIKSDDDINWYLYLSNSSLTVQGLDSEERTYLMTMMGQNVTVVTLEKAGALPIFRGAYLTYPGECNCP